MAHSATKSLSNQPLLLKPGNDSFAPPFKKIEAAFSTPYRQDPQSAFKTPIKSSGGPDHLRKRLAYVDQHSPQPEKKLKLDADCRNQSELVVVTVSLEESARNVETKTVDKSAGNGDGDSELRQNQEEGKSNATPKSSVVNDKCCHLETVRESQLKRIEEKRSAQSVKPIARALFTMKKTSQRVSLKHAVSGATPGGHDMQQVRIICLGFFQLTLFCVSYQCISELFGVHHMITLSVHSFYFMFLSKMLLTMLHMGVISTINYNIWFMQKSVLACSGYVSF